MRCHEFNLSRRIGECNRKVGAPRKRHRDRPHEARPHRAQQRQPHSLRSRTGELRCGFVVSRLRAQAPPGWSSAGPRRITHPSHSHHQLGNRSRTRKPRPAASCPRWTGTDAPGRYLQPVPWVPRDGPGIRTGASSGPSKRYCSVSILASLTGLHLHLSRSVTRSPARPPHASAAGSRSATSGFTYHFLVVFALVCPAHVASR